VSFPDELSDDEDDHKSDEKQDGKNWQNSHPKAFTNARTAYPTTAIVPHTAATRALGDVRRRCQLRMDTGVMPNAARP
jgi:hypothetical protein